MTEKEFYQDKKKLSCPTQKKIKALEKSQQQLQILLNFYNKELTKPDLHPEVKSDFEKDKAEVEIKLQNTKTAIDILIKADLKLCRLSDVLNKGVKQ